MADWRTGLIVRTKDVLVRSPWRRRVLPRYAYNFDAAQLCFLCECLERTRDAGGCIVEIGVAGGETTLFLNNYLDAVRIDKEYVAVDTFAGFVHNDVHFEVTRRGKRREDYEGIDGFRVNKKAWYDATMRMNGVTRVRSIQADVNEFDLQALGTIAFCLLDLDLYRPIKKALGEVYKALSVGGIIVVDDCSRADIRWDGALQAYQEFMGTLGQPERIVHGKLGVVTK
jgi:O-methyltransferase